MKRPAFAAHVIPKDKIRALHADVLVADMEFDTRITQSGLILPNDNGTTLGIRPRWGRVYAVGPEQTDVQVGQWIMVAHGRWTRGVDIDDGNSTHLRTIRKIDPDDILLVSESDLCPEDATWSSAIHVQKQNKD